MNLLLWQSRKQIMICLDAIWNQTLYIAHLLKKYLRLQIDIHSAFRLLGRLISAISKGITNVMTEKDLGIKV